MSASKADFAHTEVLMSTITTHQKKNDQQETNTPHPSVKHCADKVDARYRHGRPDSELVPSRYALKVGNIDVMVVSDGLLSLPSAMLGQKSTRPSGRPGWRICSCPRMRSSGR